MVCTLYADDLRRRGPGSQWTDERTQKLRDLWDAGWSCTQIADRLGGVTRNAVIGKVHRLGLSGRATTFRKPENRPRARRVAAKKAAPRPKFVERGNPALRALMHAEPLPVAIEELDIPASDRVALADLTDCSCRWPIGDPQAADFHFCNRKKFTGLPYCEFHARRAFQAPQPRRHSIDNGGRHFKGSIGGQMIADIQALKNVEELVDA